MTEPAAAVHHLLCDPGSEPHLLAEISRQWPDAAPPSPLLVAGGPCPGWISTAAPLAGSERPLLAFCRQALPQARLASASSINQWADQLAETAMRSLPFDQPWRLHLWPDYGTDRRAGENRCRLIREAFLDRLKRKRKQLLRSFTESEAPLDPQTSLIQLALHSPESGSLSLSLAPQPWRFRTIVWPFPRGELPVAEDKAAPSRAFAKLLEAELRLGCRIAHGELCIDLGASPGSWSYVALNRGAKVIAVDRSELREDLMRNPSLHFHQGDAFKFIPDSRADWLLCDVIAAPQRSIDLLIGWLQHRRMSRFIVTIKFKGEDEYPLIDQLKHTAAPLCREFHLVRLCANKNEVCAFGIVQHSHPA